MLFEKLCEIEQKIQNCIIALSIPILEVELGYKSR